MYQLLVNYSGWPTAGRAVAGRLFEYTEEYVISRFRDPPPGAKIHFAAMMLIPAVFMTEEGGGGEQVARIGRIIRAQDHKNGWQIDYSFDSDFPPIPISVVHAMEAELQIEQYEFSRTHWAIKDVDLFEVLLRKGAARRLAPKVFTFVEEPINELLVAAMMPFEARFDGTLAALQNAAICVGMSCQRANDIWVHDHVLQDIIRLLCTAKVVVADVTDKNANVFYEVGIAHTLGKDVILITQHGDHVPFDLRHIRYLTYLPNAEGLTKLSGEVQTRIRTLTGR